MKKLKKSLKQWAVKLFYTFTVVTMVLQPVSSPGILRAMAADSTSSLQADETVASEATSAPDPTPAPQEEPAPIVKEETSALAETVVPAVDPTPATDPAPETPAVVAPTDTVSADTIAVPTTDESVSPTTETPPTEGIITPEAAAIVVSDTVPKEIWTVDGEKATTNDPVVLGKTYVAPQNDQVTVSFTKLPDNPGTLSIEEITLSDAQVKSLHALSNKAYDITSDMADGTFKYKMTLPNSKDEKNVQIKFAEDVAGLKNAETVPTGDVDVNKDNVNATLNHFTVFVLVEWNFPNNPDDAIADGGVPMNAAKTITVLGGAGTIGFANVGATTNSARATGWDSGSGLKNWRVIFDATGFKNLTVSSKQRSSNTGPRDFKMQYKIGAGGTWTDFGPASITVANDYLSGVTSNVSLPSAADNQPDVRIRWIMVSNIAVNGAAVQFGGASNIDDIVVTGDDDTTAPAVGSITIIKNTVGGNGIFSFTSNTLPDASFNITTSGNTGSTTYTDLATGTYDVSETVPAGWNLTSATCDDENTIDAINVDPDETVTCTFTNTKKPTLAIYKVCDPAGDTGLFNLQIDGSNVTSDTICGGWTNGQIEVTIGSHTVGETGGSGTDLANYTVVISGDCASDGSVTLAAGENKSCTITNTKKGKIIVEKQTLPDGSAQSFEFTTNYGDGNDVEDGVDGENVFFLTDGQQNDSGYLVPGAYSVSETVPEGWDQTEVNCESSIEDGESQIDPAEINLQPGEIITCTFTNTQRGKITIIKTTEHDTHKLFPFTSDFASGFNLPQNGSWTSEFLVSGAYTVSEGGLNSDHWSFKSLNCVDATQQATFVQNKKVVTVNLMPGSDVTCTYYNVYSRDDNDNGDNGDGGDGNGGGTNGGGTFTAFTGGAEGSVAGAETGNEAGGEAGTEQVQDEETGPEGEQSGTVAGEETGGCTSWPLWVWVLALIVYGGAFNWRSFSNLKNQQHRRLAWQAAFTVGALVFWYYNDICRAYAWFPWVVVMGGIGSLWYYIYRFGRVGRKA